LLDGDGIWAGSISSVAVMTTKGSKSDHSPTLVIRKDNSFSKSKGLSAVGNAQIVQYLRKAHMSCKRGRKNDISTLEKGIGKAVSVPSESQLSLIPMTGFSASMKPDNYSRVLCSSNTEDASASIIISGVTNHMTFGPMYFSHSTPRRNCIANANEVTYPITCVGTVPLLP